MKTVQMYGETKIAFTVWIPVKKNGNDMDLYSPITIPPGPDDTLPYGWEWRAFRLEEIK